MGTGAAVTDHPKAKRRRRMTPLERTRILPTRPDDEGPPVPGAPPKPSYVLVGDSSVGGLDPPVPPVAILDRRLRVNRRRCHVRAGVYEMERWLAGKGLSYDLFELLPTFAEVVTEVARGDGDAY